MSQISSYKEELAELHHRRVYFIVLVGSLLIFLFSFLDYLIAPELFREFLFYRAIAAGLGIILILANYHDQNHNHPLIIGFLGSLCVAVTILVTIYRMDGAASPYFVGLIVTMTIYTALAPLTLNQTLVSGFGLVGCYLITILLNQSLTPAYLMVLFHNLFFMICFVFIAATQSWTETSARQQEFGLRQQENITAAELADHATILEQEVDKRSREQAASEQRYRQLFNQIADDVAVVTAEGRIIQSNDSFENHYGNATIKGEKSFLDIIPENDKHEIKNILSNMVTTGQPLSEIQLSLIRKNGQRSEAEINGTILSRQGMTIGILMVIRDISTRKFLEKRLVDSLEMKKRTEGATILALAKLSEYRDVTPGNHLERIREYCKELAMELTTHREFVDIVTTGYIQDLYHASILHDIGKVSLPDKILNKTEKLTKQEEDSIRQHTLVGGDVIKEMEEESRGSGFLAIAKQIAYFHHERWDGKGYPYGLAEEEIPLAARIMALADSYEELTTSPPYPATNPLSHTEAVQFIVKKSGFQFDPILVEALLNRQQEFNSIRTKFSEH